MKPKNIRIIFFTCVALMLSDVMALEITIEQGVENPIPVAIVPFA